MGAGRPGFVHGVCAWQPHHLIPHQACVILQQQRAAYSSQTTVTKGIGLCEFAITPTSMQCMVDLSLKCMSCNMVMLTTGGMCAYASENTKARKQMP